MPKFILSSLSSRSKATSLRTLDVRPDDSDARDYVFEPSLSPLPDSIDHRGYARVLDQKNEGACVGFALATVIHVSLAGQAERQGTARPKRIEEVSPRMLYEMAKRYDEWKGEDYEGTSLRGAMKGWHKHGVTTDAKWPYFKNDKISRDREFTLKRAEDAARRPIGAYYRIVDSDVSHVQAAICEGDAVLVSAYVHAGWHHEKLQRPKGGGLSRIRPKYAKRGLHAFAVIGYARDGFIVQNSWGTGWGTNGRALLSYEDWFDNRQDAWVARPAPESRDFTGQPRIWAVDFAGRPDVQRAGSSSVGLDLDPQVLPYLINTGDRGELSTGGSLRTREDELPGMAQQVLTTPDLNGTRHVILYAHGGFNSETLAAQTASRLWHSARERKLGSYFFIWESGVTESIWGWLKSDDDATGPAGFSLSDAWENIKKGTRKQVREAQKFLGEQLADTVRTVFWDEMKKRARGASAPLEGGAALFLDELFKVMASTPDDKYRIHLVGHSAGSIYLGWLYQQKLKGLLDKNKHVTKNVTLGSIQLLAPAITLKQAQQAFLPAGERAVLQNKFTVYMLESADEDNDSIQIYPSSLLTYVADCLEDHPGKKVPLLGIQKYFTAGGGVRFATPVLATESVKHGEFDDARHEIELVLDGIASGKF